MALEAYEEEVLLQMYDHQIIGHNYKSTQRMAAIIKWSDIAQKYGVRKSFPRVLRRLIIKGYVDDHGKRGKAGSLSRFGVLYVIGKRK